MSTTPETLERLLAIVTAQAKLQIATQRVIDCKGDFNNALIPARDLATAAAIELRDLVTPSR